MRCDICGVDYPSKYFSISSEAICNGCFKKQPVNEETIEQGIEKLEKNIKKTTNSQKKLNFNINFILIIFGLCIFLIGGFSPDIADQAGWLTWEKRFNNTRDELEIQCVRGNMKACEWLKTIYQQNSRSNNYRWTVRSEYFAKAGITVGVGSFVLMFIISLIKRRN